MIRICAADLQRPLEIVDSTNFRQIAELWRHVVDNRRRWSHSAKSEIQHSSRLRKDLADSMGIQDEDLQRLAQNRLVEVQFPDLVGEGSELARRFPWEYCLSVASKPFRSREWRLTVVRSFGRPSSAGQNGESESGSAERPSRPGIKEVKFLFVESAPGRLERAFDFQSERTLARVYAAGLSATGEDTDKFRSLRQKPTLADVEAEVIGHPPNITHIAGVDAHEGAPLLRFPAPQEDGIYFSDGRGVCLAGVAKLARAVVATSHPLLVALSAFNTASSLAPAIVEAGAELAIGFDVLLERETVEKFFASFYEVFRRNGFENPAAAFETAYQGLRFQESEEVGSGIVLWSASSLLPQFAHGRRPGPPDEEDSDDLDTSNLHVLFNNLLCTVEPTSKINYSVLHNSFSEPQATLSYGTRLFRKFKIENRSDARALGVEVEVILHVGADSFPFRRSIQLERAMSEELQDLIRVPLTSELARSIRESIRTGLYVRIAYRGVKIYEETHEVTLLPVNEWSDDLENGLWLPSFVLPRDPAIAPLVSSSLKYLKAIVDDPIRGFDGYQGGHLKSQVQAIWSALVHDLKLDYLNPPPSYSPYGQRLRTPSQVIRGGAGTCIDLALLFAGCLELVDIAPVLFLLKGHALTGYWADEKRRADMIEGFWRESRELNEAVEAESQEPAKVGAAGWIFNEPTKVKAWAGAGALVPIEATALARRLGLDEAIQEGAARLESSFKFELDSKGRPVRSFDYMIDIRVAREKNVTPLPVFGDEI